MSDTLILVPLGIGSVGGPIKRGSAGSVGGELTSKLFL